MSGVYNSVSTNDVQPFLGASSVVHDELELNTIVSKLAVSTEESSQYVTVTAPTNLPAGYELTVDVMDGSFWTVQVPDGGVSMNESFRAKVMHKTNVVRAELVAASSLISKSNPYQSTTKRVKFHIPTGRWRDGIFDCCIIPFHPIVFLTYCWPLITLGQVMTRMKVHVCCGNDDRSKIPPRAIFIMLTIVPYYLGGLSNKLFTIGVEVFYADGDVVSILGDTLGMSVLRIILIFGFSVFIWVIHTKTRNQMRRAYSIGNDMSCLGDCCCAFWCGTCSICQMARHTANYHNTHRARCCTSNGLDEEWDDYDFLTVDPNVHPQGSTGAMIV